MGRTVPTRSAEIVELKSTRAATARRSSSLEASVAQLGAWFPILVGAVFGLVYELSIVFAGGRIARPLATPYAVPIFDTPFALVAVGVGYLCLERHRLRQDFRSARSEEHTSELQSRLHLVCRLLLEKKKKTFRDTR